MLETLETPTTDVTTGVVLTESAAQKLKDTLAEKGVAETHALRVFVQGGGCGGMQYGMTFDDNPREDDEVSEQFGVKISRSSWIRSACSTSMALASTT